MVTELILNQKEGAGQEMRPSPLPSLALQLGTAQDTAGSRNNAASTVARGQGCGAFPGGQDYGHSEVGCEKLDWKDLYVLNKTVRLVRAWAPRSSEDLEETGSMKTKSEGHHAMGPWTGGTQ